MEAVGGTEVCGVVDQDGREEEGRPGVSTVNDFSAIFVFESDVKELVLMNVVLELTLAQGEGGGE